MVLARSLTSDSLRIVLALSWKLGTSSLSAHSSASRKSSEVSFCLIPLVRHRGFERLPISCVRKRLVRLSQSPCRFGWHSITPRPSHLPQSGADISGPSSGRTPDQELRHVCWRGSLCERSTMGPRYETLESQRSQARSVWDS